MLLFDGFGGLLVLGLWIFCFIDVLMTPETACRNLPKLAWVFLVLLLPVFGSIVWLVAGPSVGRRAGRRFDAVGTVGTAQPHAGPHARPTPTTTRSSSPA